MRWTYLPTGWFVSATYEDAVLCHLFEGCRSDERPLTHLIKAGFTLRDCDIGARYFQLLVTSAVRNQDYLMMELIVDAVMYGLRSGKALPPSLIYFREEDSVFSREDNTWVLSGDAFVASMKFMWWCWQQFYQQGVTQNPVCLHVQRYSLLQYDAAYCFERLHNYGVPVPLLLYEMGEWMPDQHPSVQRFVRIELQHTLDLRRTLQDMTKLSGAHDPVTLFDVGPLVNLICAYTIPTNERIVQAAERVRKDWDNRIQDREAMAQPESKRRKT
jgi:hypothetical protein